MSAQHQFNPSEYSTEQLDRFLFALMGRMKLHYSNGVERPMTKKLIAEYLHVSEQQIDKLEKAGVLPAHRMTDGGDPRYFASEAHARLKKS